MGAHSFEQEHATTVIFLGFLKMDPLRIWTTRSTTQSYTIEILAQGHLLSTWIFNKVQSGTQKVE